MSALNDKADAFRHAYFNALNARDCGRNRDGQSYAKLFSDAHESEDPAILHLERTMDLYNNSIGIDVGHSYFIPIFVGDQTVANDIYDKLVAGELKYLKPLNFVASPLYDVNPKDKIQDCPTCLNGIGATTTIVWTNQ